MVAKRIKFALKMKDGVEVRTLQELKQSFDLNQVVSYYLDGKLETWLLDRYYEDIADQILKLDKSDPELRRRLSEIFEVEYQEDTMSIEEIEARNQRIKKLKEITDDEEIIKNVDYVAFCQEELADLLDEGVETVYLCGADFQIPMSKKGITYIGVNMKLNINREKRERYKGNGIELINLFDIDEMEQEQYEKNIDDVQAVFLCKADPDKTSRENFLVYATKDILPYNYYKEDGLNIEYQASLKLVKWQPVLKYRDVVYDGDKIVYKGFDEQGDVLGVMDPNGQNNRILKHIDFYDSVLEYIVGKDYILARVGGMLDGLGDILDRLVPSCLKGRSGIKKDYEVISTNGVIKKVQEISGDIFPEKFWKMPQGFYAIVYDENEGNVILFELLNGKDQIKIYKDLPLHSKNGIEYRMRSDYGDCDSGRIYFCLESIYSGDGKSYFYFCDIKKREVHLVINPQIQYPCVGSKFVVKDDKIIYSDIVKNIIVLDILSEKFHYLWEKIKTVMGIDMDWELVGDYLYFIKKIKDASNPDSIDMSISKIYRIKLDGTEKTMVWDEENYKDIGNVEIDIQKINEICIQRNTR